MYLPHLGTPAKRRKDEIRRLNELYVEIIPTQKTIQKCLKYLCDTQTYRMLRDWSYEDPTDPLPSNIPSGPPEFTDENENDLNNLDTIADEVIFNLSQEIDKPKKAKLSRKKRNEKRIEVLNQFLFLLNSLKCKLCLLTPILFTVK